MSALPFDLAQEYEALVQFLYMAPVGLVQASIDGEIAMINPLSAQLLMPLAGDGNLTDLFAALKPVAPDLQHQVLTFKGAYGTVCNGIRLPVTGASGASQPSMLSLTVIKLDAGRIMAVITDITEQVAREKLLRKNEAWLNAIMMGVTDYALVRLDDQGRIDDWNPSIERLTGFGREDVTGRSMALFYPPGGTTDERILDRLREADESGWSLDEGWRAKADGSRFWGSAMIVPFDAPRDASAPVAPVTAAEGAARSYSLVIRDITDKRDAFEAQRIMLCCDHLTSVANRRTFFEAGELEFAHGVRHPRKLSLLVLDLDRFKSVNDCFGHPVGDAVLREFAALLVRTFRAVDTVARIGGEEFAVLMPSTDRAQAALDAERLRVLAESLVVEADGQSIRFTVSGGLVTVDSDASDLDKLMKQADDALYAAKAAGRNRIVEWTPGHDFPSRQGGPIRP
jgi:diguanylate cyclase (GGDEF)-like protein/PAS domain S-box-containing protein